MAEQRTQKQIAEARGVSIRTVKRWAKVCDIQDDAAIDRYLEQRQHPGKSEPTVVTPDPAPTALAPTQPVERGQFNIESTDDLIKTLNASAGEARADLDRARRAGKSSREVAVCAKTLNDTVQRLAGVLLDRDKLHQNTERGYPTQDIAAVFTLFHEMLRWSVFEGLPVTILNGLQRSGLIHERLGEAEDVIRRAVKNALFPTLSDFGAALPSELLGVKREISLDERRKLESALGEFIKIKGIS